MELKSRALWLAAALAPLVAPSPATAQDLISFSELIQLPAPAPEARISYGSGPLQFGNLRLPRGDGPYPVIVFIHGGCWLSPYDIAHVAPAEQALTDAGYAVWSIEYRRVGDDGGGWPGTFLDVGNGIDYVRELARQYPLDLDRVIVSGHSAGGYFAIWAAARPRIPESSELHVDQPLPVRGVLALAPAATLEAIQAQGACGAAMDVLLGGGPADYPDRYAATSVMRLMPVGVPQRLVVGRLDRAWGPSGRRYFEAAQAAGVSRVTLREAPESGHLEVIVPSSSTWPIVLEELEALSQDPR